MSYVSQIYQTLNLHKGEGKMVRYLALYSFFQSAALALLFTSASAIFLAHYTIDTLPYVFMAAGILLMASYKFYNFLERFFTIRVLMLADVGVLLLSILVLRAGYGLVSISVFALWLIIWHRVMAVYLGAGFGKLVLLLFNVRQSKRLLGLVTSLDIPASVLGYLLASLLVPSIGTINLLWLSAGVLLIAIICLFFLQRSSKDQFKIKAAPPLNFQLDRSHTTPSYFGSDFVFFLSLSCFLAVFTFILIEYAFLSQVDAKFGSEESIAYFIGIILGIGQLMAFLIKTAFYRTLLRKFGTKVVLLILPVTLALVTFISLSSSALFKQSTVILWIWVGIMLVTDTLKSAIYNNSFLSMLQPMPQQPKLAGYDILGQVEALAIGLAGLLAIGLSWLNLPSLSLFALCLLVVILGWLASIVMLNKKYVAIVQQALKKRNLYNGTQQIHDKETLELLHSKLLSNYPNEVIYALSLLNALPQEVYEPILARMLNHPSREVRQEVLRQIMQLRAVSLAPQIEAQLSMEGQADLLKNLVLTYCLLTEAQAIPKVASYLESKNTALQTGALVGLLRYGGIEGVLMAGQYVLQYANAEQAAKRAYAAQVIGETAIENFYHPLLRLLADKDQEVKINALKAASSVGHTRLVPIIIGHLKHDDIADKAIQALVAIGISAIPSLTETFNTPESSVVVKRRIVQILGKIKGAEAVSFLELHLYHTALEVRNAVHKALAQCNYHTSSSQPKEKLLDILDKELADASWFLACHRTILRSGYRKNEQENQQLIQAIIIELDHLKKRILHLISFIYPKHSAYQLWQNLQSKRAEQRANTLEILELLLSKELSSIIIPLLEEEPNPALYKLYTSKYPVPPLALQGFLKPLISQNIGLSVQPWTQTIAIYWAYTYKEASMASFIAEAAHHPHNMVRQTAHFALQNFYSHNYIAFLDNTLSSSSNHTTVLTMENQKLLTVEKVMALKTTRIFNNTSEDILAEIANILREVEVAPGEDIVKKGDAGTCMYIIFEGKVKVHDGGHTLATLGNRDFFGELSLLDTEPRSAHVTAVEPSILLRLDQPDFYEIMADKVEIIKEIMKILCRRLREQNELVAQLKHQN